MKEITKYRTHVEEYKMYEALDGEEFADKNECLKYEEFILGAVPKSIEHLIVSTDNDAWSLMGGCDEHTVMALKFNNTTEIDTLIDWLLIASPWCESRKKEIESILDTAYTSGDIILLGQNPDGDYYFINSRQNIINNLMGLDKKKEK